jgi:hypothetical protein
VNAVRKDTPIRVVRSGAAVLIVLVAAVVLNGYVVVFEIATAQGFFVDQFFLTAICGLVAAGAVAVATSGIQLRGRTLLAVDIVTVTAIDAAQLAEVEDLAGLTIVTRSGRRVQPYVCGRTLSKQLSPNARLRASGERIRVWAAGPLDDDATRSTERRTVRWTVLAGVPLWGALCGGLTVALHAVVH